MRIYLHRFLIIFITMLTALDSITASPSASDENNKKPNIIYILADDLGYGDVSCLNENSQIKTVNIDRLAERGMIFSDAHSGSAVCTPTRYGILTGRYSWRTKLQRGVLEGYSPPLIDSNRLTVASLLKENGYSTACIGKWHLGWDWGLKENPANTDLSKIKFEHVDFTKPIDNGPNDIGFEYFYGISASLDMDPYVYVENDKTVEMPTEYFEGYRDYKFARSGRIAPGFDHQTSLRHLTDKALEFIDHSVNEEKDKPFFLYFPLTAPHTPIIPGKDFEGKSGIGPYGDFVLECDWTVGKILEALKRNGIEKNTLLIFTSDNGCSPQAKFDELESYGHDPSYIYRGYKSDIFEGGHRIPFIASWPGFISPKTIYKNTVCLTDFLATVSDILEYELPSNSGEDSFSLLRYFQDPDSKSQRAAVVHHSIDGLFAIRKGKWKLELAPGSGGWSSPKDYEAINQGYPMIQLYDLDKDVGETNNVQGDYPDVVNELVNLLGQYINNGRSTPGLKEDNDTEVSIWKYLPHRKEKLNLSTIDHKGVGAELKLKRELNISYSTNGIKVLNDGLEATDDYKDGYWAGIEGDDLEFDILLKEKQNIKSLQVRCMENQNSWIFFPREIEAYYYNGNDEKIFLSGMENPEPVKSDGTAINNFILHFENIQTEKIHLSIKSLGRCPSWHPGAGGKAWLFIDEVIVK